MKQNKICRSAERLLNARNGFKTCPCILFFSYANNKAKNTFSITFNLFIILIAQFILTLYSIYSSTFDV